MPRYEVTRALTRYIIVAENSEDYEWEESPDVEETVEEVNW